MSKMTRFSRALPSTISRVKSGIEQALRDAPDGLVLTELYRKVVGHGGTVRGVLYSLVDAGAVERVAYKSGRPGSRVTTRYRLRRSRQQAASLATASAMAAEKLRHAFINQFGGAASRATPVAEEAAAEQNVVDKAWSWWFDHERPDRAGTERELWDAVQQLLRCQRPARR